jgi:hypothetical protein
MINNVSKNATDVAIATGSLDRARLVSIKIDDGGVIKDIHNFVGVYNISSGLFCCSVAPNYNLVQHKEFFDSFAQAMDRLNLKYTMQLNTTGNIAFADIEFEGHNVKLSKVGEEFTSGIRLINSYNKLTGVSVVPRYTRLACSNGMLITHSARTISIKHNSKLLQEISSFVERKLNDIINDHDDLKRWVESCIADSIEWGTVTKILGKMFAQVKHREQILKNLGISMVITKDGEKKKTFTYVMDDGNNAKKITRWELYNAITQYATHGEHITPWVESAYQLRAEKILHTPLVELPQEVVLVDSQR